MDGRATRRTKPGTSVLPEGSRRKRVILLNRLHGARKEGAGQSEGGYKTTNTRIRVKENHQQPEQKKRKRDKNDSGRPEGGNWGEGAPRKGRTREKGKAESGLRAKSYAVKESHHTQFEKGKNRQNRQNRNMV